MKKNYFLNSYKWLTTMLLIFGVAVSLSAATVGIGNGGTTTNTAYPIYSCYNYNYTQQIVLASEYAASGAAGNITSVKYFYTSGGATLANWQDWTIYMGHTTKTEFTSNTDWIPVSSLNQVFTGTITAVSNTWVEITFTTPFNYNGTDNIVIAIDENSSGYSCTANWYSYNTPEGGNRGIRYYSDPTNPDPASPPTANGSSPSSTIAQIQFEGVAAACPAPSNLISNVISSSEVDLLWTSSATNWELEYGVAGFAQGSGTVVSVSGNDSLNVTGLSLANTEYDWYVRSICGTDTSVFFGPSSFLTLCDPYTAPYSQDFDATTDPVYDACWTGLEELTNTTGEFIDAYGFTFPPAHSGVNSIEMYNSGGTATDGDLIFVSPQFTDFGDSMRVKFWLFDESNGSDIIVGTMSDPTDATTFTAFTTITEAMMADDVWEQHIISFSTYTGTDQYVAFKHGANSTFDYIYLDDFVYEVSPSCSEPTVLVVNSTSDTSANLSWTSTASDFIIEYGTTGFVPGSGTVVVSNSNPFDLTGLSPNTSYDWYVKDSCAVGVTSVYSNVSSFTTNCVPFVAPYFESFDSTFIPDCWSQSSTTGGPFVFGAPGISWNTLGCSTAPVDHTGNSGNFATLDHSSTDVGVVLEMNDVDVSALTVPYLEFYYTMCGAGYSPVNPTFVEAWDGSAWNVIMTLGSTNGWELQGVVLTGLNYSGNLVKLRFRAESGGSSSDYFGDVAIDDVSIDEAPPCPGTPSDLGVENLSMTATDIVWTNVNTATAWVVEWGVSGFAQGSGTVVSEMDTFSSLSGLTADTDYEFYVRDYCGGTDSSAWAGPFQFYTGYCVPAPSSVDNDGITNVTMGTIDNSTLAELGNYGDFSAMITDAGQGVDFAIDVTLQTGYTYNVWVWVDWNDDLDFDDADEEFYLGQSLSSSPYTLSSFITIPATATTGNHKIRIGGADSGLGSTSPSNPCYTGSYGSFEDYTLNIITCNGATSTEAVTVCDNEPLVLSDGSTTDTSGTYVDTLYQASGCDSVVTYNVTVLPSYSDTIDVEFCDGDSFVLSDGTVITSSGMYPDSMSTVDGCDSVANYNVEVLMHTSSTQQVDLCSGGTFTMMDGTVVDSTGTYEEVITNADGCDSTITYNVVVGLATASVQEIALCDGDSFTLPTGDVVTDANTYLVYETNAAGCDSIVSYVVTTGMTTNDSIVAEICDGESYLFDGQMLTASGDYTMMASSVSGCDSIVVLTLTVLPASSSTLDEAICEGDSYMFDGSALTDAGTYTAVMPAVNGCDSTITLNLTVNENTTASMMVTICDGDSYMFGGSALTTSGTYTATSTNSSGCDLVTTLTLTVDPAANETDSVSICKGDSYVFGTQTLIASGVYTETFTNDNGCDYDIQLTLTVGNDVSTSEDILLCGDQTSYELANGTVVTAAGIYTATVTNSTGCSNIITYNVSTCVGIFDVANNVGMIAFPNPATDKLNVQFEERLSNENQISIVNVLGQTVFNTVNFDELLLEVNTSNFNAGVYYINVTSDNKTSITPFSVVK